MIKLKNILAENMLRFGTKNLSETMKRALLEFDPNYPSEKIVRPGDPSQKSVTITTELTAVDSAIESFVAEYNKKYLAGMIDARDLGKKYNERILISGLIQNL